VNEIESQVTLGVAIGHKGAETSGQRGDAKLTKRLIHCDRAEIGQLKPGRSWLLNAGLDRMPARQRGLDGMLKRFPAWRTSPLPQLAEFSQGPFDRSDLARSRKKMLHGVVDFRQARVITPASEQARESEQRDGGGEFRLLAAEVPGCPH
jgi:hypothetical protein